MYYSLHNDPSSRCVIMYVTVMMTCVMTYMSVQCDVPLQSRSPIVDRYSFPVFQADLCDNTHDGIFDGSSKCLHIHVLIFKKLDFSPMEPEVKPFAEKFGKRILVKCNDLSFNLQCCVAENEEGPTTNVIFLLKSAGV